MQRSRSDLRACSWHLADALQGHAEACSATGLAPAGGMAAARLTDEARTAPKVSRSPRTPWAGDTGSSEFLEQGSVSDYTSSVRALAMEMDGFDANSDRRIDFKEFSRLVRAPMAHPVPALHTA